MKTTTNRLMVEKIVGYEGTADEVIRHVYKTIKPNLNENEMQAEKVIEKFESGEWVVYTFYHVTVPNKNMRFASIRKHGHDKFLVSYEWIDIKDTMEDW